MLTHLEIECRKLSSATGMETKIDNKIQRRIFIFSFGGGWINIWGGAAACFGRGAVATPGKAKENV